MSDTPGLSIVLPVLNRADMVRHAISSIVTQGVENVEIIAVDGGSTDGTQRAIGTFTEVHLIEAPQSSIYQAINTGVTAARGAIIGHVNSDDRLLPGALAGIIDAVRRNPGAELVRGRAFFVRHGSRGQIVPEPQHDARVSSCFDLKAVLFGTPAINACFIRASAYRRIGLYDENLRIAADREWLLRALLSGISVERLDLPVYEYLIHAGSTTIAGRARANEIDYVREHLAIAERYLALPHPPEVARILRRWHAHELVRLFGIRGARRADIVHASRVSPTWPLKAIGPVSRTLSRKIRRVVNASLTSP